MAEVKIQITAEDGAGGVFRAVEEGSRSAFDSVDSSARKGSGAVREFGHSCDLVKGRVRDFIAGLAGFEILKRTAGWVKGLVGSFLEAANTTEQYETRLQVLLGSQEEGARLFREMTEYASRVPFEFEQVMGSATQLAGVMKGGVDEIRQWMPMIGDLAAASGLSIEQATEQVIRMYSAGAGAADLFRERGILAMMGFETGVSYSAEETGRKMMEAWQKADSRFRGATEKLADTWTGLMSMLKDKWFQFRNAVMESAVFDWMKAALSMINDKIRESGGSMKEFARTLGTGVVSAFEAVARAGALVGDTFYGLDLLWNTLKMGFFKFAKAVWEGLHAVRSGVTNFVSSFNLFGFFDTYLENSKRIMGEQTQVINMLETEITQSEKRLEELASKGVLPTYKKVNSVIEEIHNRMKDLSKDANIKPKVDPAGAKEGMKEIEQSSRDMTSSVTGNIGEMAKTAEEYFYPNSPAIRGMQLFIESVKPLEGFSFSFGVSGFGEFISTIEEKLGLNSLAVINLDGLIEDLERLDGMDMKLDMDISGVEAAVEKVKAALGSIPDVTYRKVVVRYEGEASSRKPLMEKIAEIRSAMDSLPSEGEHMMRFYGEASEKKPLSEKLKDIIRELTDVGDYWTEYFFKFADFEGASASRQLKLYQDLKDWLDYMTKMEDLSPFGVSTETDRSMQAAMQILSIMEKIMDGAGSAADSMKSAAEEAEKVHKTFVKPGSLGGGGHSESGPSAAEDYSNGAGSVVPGSYARRDEPPTAVRPVPSLPPGIGGDYGIMDAGLMPVGSNGPLSRSGPAMPYMERMYQGDRQVRQPIMMGNANININLPNARKLPESDFELDLIAKKIFRKLREVGEQWRIL